MKTSKNKQKRNSYNAWVIEQIQKRHGFSRRYIAQCLLGERTSLTADTIKKQYRELEIKMKKTLDDMANTALDSIISRGNKHSIK